MCETQKRLLFTNYKSYNDKPTTVFPLHQDLNILINIFLFYYTTLETARNKSIHWEGEKKESEPQQILYAANERFINGTYDTKLPHELM